MKKEIKWTIDQAHSDITFKVRHLMIAHVKGKFNRFDASIYTTDKDFTTAEIDVWIDASSINTGNPERDEHLKSVDFLDTQNHKQITFKSSTMGKSDKEGNSELWGELTIKGITKNIQVNVQFGGIARDVMGTEKAGFTVSTKINRRAWELYWNAPMEDGAAMVGEEVIISCDIELTNVGQKDLIMELNPSYYKKSLL